MRKSGGTQQSSLTATDIVPRGVDDALTIADHGYRVFRVSLQPQADGTYKKVPHNWAATATRDPAKIRRMWSGRNTDSFIGYATGDGVVGVDVDNKHGKAGQAWWEAQGFNLLLGYTYPTLSGGWHCLAQTDTKIGCPQLWATHGIDIKGEGGWLFAHAIPPRKSELPRLPEPLEDALRRPEKEVPPATGTSGPERVFATEIPDRVRLIIDRELARLDECQVVGWGTSWNNTTFAVACQLVQISNTPELGYSSEQAHADHAARAPQDENFGPTEIEERWQSALKTVGTKDRPDLIPTGPSFPEWVEDETPSRGADPWMSNLVPGDEFILGAPDHVVPLWGAGSQVLWSKGEALMITGPQGVGKTTVVGQVVRALMLGGDVLGLPVSRRNRTLYLAMDRPAQIARSIRRTLRDLDPEFLRQHVTFWKGPPPADLARDTGALLRLARLADADTVVIDSLKDAALKLSEDETGSAYNRARQTALAAGVEIIELHHMVKSGSNGKGSKPTTLPDVYGSVWLTSGVGSVILLWGEPGDPVVELTHLKQPAETIGPLSVTHDHDTGTSTVNDKRDVVGFVRQFKDGVTAKDVADFMFNGDTSPNKVARARRRLTTLTKENRLAVRVAGDKSTPTVWAITASITPPDPAESTTDPP